jgi:hypothetical protein
MKLTLISEYISTLSSAAVTRKPKVQRAVLWGAEVVRRAGESSL